MTIERDRAVRLLELREKQVARVTTRKRLGEALERLLCSGMFAPARAPCRREKPIPSTARMERSRRLYDGEGTREDIEYQHTGRDRLPCAKEWDRSVAAYNAPPRISPRAEAFKTVVNAIERGRSKYPTLREHELAARNEP